METGLALMPFSISMLVFAIIGARLSARFFAHLIIRVGFVLAAAWRRAGVLTDAEALERAAYELAEDCIAENVRYLEVRFAPAFLSFLSSVWGDYWVIDLADDYSWAVVGEPKRRYLWVLSRTSERRSFHHENPGRCMSACMG